MEFTLNEIVAVTGGVLRNAETLSVALDQPLRIHTDSRDVTSGSIFWALRGDTYNGHDFVPSIAQVATCCMVERRWLRKLREPIATPIIAVDDSLAALGQLAAWNRQRGPLQVVGITGSFGKTTTREMIHTVLSSRFSSHRSPRNFNNHYGVPLTLLGISSRTEVAVVELGASARGEITRLCEIATPDIGVITGIGHAHAADFGGPEHVVTAKGELAAALPGRGVLFLWGDDPKANELAARASCRVVRVGLGPHNDLRADSVVQSAGTLEVTLDQATLRVPLVGRHFARSILLAVAVGREFGIPLDEIADALASFQPVKGRGTVERIGDWTVIDDSYNASPEAMQAAIALLGSFETGGQRILITGDMLALGDLSAVSHEEAGISAAAAGIDHVLSMGNFAPDLIRGARFTGLDTLRAQTFESHTDLTTHLQKILSPNDVLLVKGSRATQMEKVITWLKQHAASDISGQTENQRDPKCETTSPRSPAASDGIQTKLQCWGEG
jgi:UDP-N-acetylmuramoyl-tripeptide--D-alanyl-D-alanine ligase